jgi:hypothetical protein
MPTLAELLMNAARELESQDALIKRLTEANLNFQRLHEAIRNDRDEALQKLALLEMLVEAESENPRSGSADFCEFVGTVDRILKGGKING